MKKWLLIFLLLQSTAVLLAQQKVVQIDSLPLTGIKLRDGWKFHAGDNPEWVKADFDDSKWENINPTKDIHDIPMSPNSPIGWFRIKLKIDSSLLNRSVALHIGQNIASEIYINGKLFKKYGIVSANPAKVRGFYPYYEALEYKLNKTEQVVAVRFAIQQNLPYVNGPPRNGCFSVTINTINSAYKFSERTKKYVKLNYFDSGLFLLLAIVHLSFFLVYQKQRANLFFFIAALGSCIGIFSYTYASWNSIDLSTKVYGVFTYYLLGITVYNTFLFMAVHSLLNAKRSFYFWFLVTFTTSGIFILVIFYKWGYVFGVLLTFSLCTIESLRLAIRAYLNGNKNVGIVIIGFAIYWFLFTVFLGMMYGGLPSPSISENYSLADLLYRLSMISLPICISIYLSREYGFTSINLEKQLVEVKQLSQEKEATLLQQNAELQAALLHGQTTERKRVAADLHDNLGSTLSSIRWSMQAIDKKKLSADEQNLYINLQEMLGKAHNDIRLLSHNLLPEELEKQGLWNTLQTFVRKLNKNTLTHFDLQLPDNQARLNSKIEFELYSICLELTNNILKHAQATEAQLVFERQNGSLHLSISDNGKGLDATRQNGKGLANVTARVEALGGMWEMKNTESGVANMIVVPV